MRKLSEELIKRGLVYQFSAEKLEEIVDAGPRVLYHGFDPSADSLHVGNLVPFMLIRLLLRQGFKPILLVGGATGLIGDPKDVERALLPEEVVEQNAKSISKQARKILGDDSIPLVNNLSWTKKISLIEFLRDVGKHFTVNAMLQKETLKKRVEDPNKSISYAEFTYPLLQSYDFLHLFKKHGCTLQIGGSDQWGNITSGIDFVRRKTGEGVHGITVPLVLDASGKKFGKSEGNAVWLDSKKTSPYKFFQFWLNSPDEMVISYLKIFSERSLEEIADIEKKFLSNRQERGAQKVLAEEVTTLIHGKDSALGARSVSDVLFGGGRVSDLNKEQLGLLKTELSGASIKKSALKSKSLQDLLVLSTIASSKNEARRFISEKCLRINDVLIDENFGLDFLTNSKDGNFIIKKGKKDFAFLSVV